MVVCHLWLTVVVQINFRDLPCSQLRIDLTSSKGCGRGVPLGTVCFGVPSQARQNEISPTRPCSGKTVANCPAPHCPPVHLALVDDVIKTNCPHSTVCNQVTWFYRNFHEFHSILVTDWSAAGLCVIFLLEVYSELISSPAFHAHKTYRTANVLYLLAGFLLSFHSSDPFQMVKFYWNTKGLWTDHVQWSFSVNLSWH